MISLKSRTASRVLLWLDLFQLFAAETYYEQVKKVGSGKG
jgi:hypothetical protein